MSLLAIDWQMIAVVVAFAGFVYGLYRNSKWDRKELFSDLRKDLSEMRKDHLTLSRNIGSDLGDIKDRLSFLESAALYTMPLEPSEPNPRSKAAREMWQRRKQRRLEKKD